MKHGKDGVAKVYDGNDWVPVASLLANAEVLAAENKKLRIENSTLLGWCDQQAEIIERLSAAARRGK